MNDPYEDYDGDDEKCDCGCGRKTAPPLFANLKMQFGWNPAKPESFPMNPIPHEKRLPDAGPCILDDFLRAAK